MDPEELAEALRALRSDLVREVDDRTKLQRRYDELAKKLQYPGTAFLVDLEYKLLVDTQMVATTGTVTTGPVFETLPGNLHAVYALSAYAPFTDTPLLITDGSVIVAPANAVTLAVQRQRQTGPLRIESRVVLYNTTGVDQTVAVRVWRRLGMGS